MSMRRSGLPFLLVLAAFLYTWRLGAAELLETDECRSGVIVRDMVEGGQWLLPRTPDGSPTEKPVLYYGLCSLLSLPFGVNEWTLRIVSGIMAVATLGLTWILARLYGPPRAAAVALAALMSNTVFITWARTAMVDMTFAFFITAGLTAYAARREGGLGTWPSALLAGTAFGLAVLTKGPLGLALPVAMLGGDLLVTTRGRFWRASLPWTAILSAGALAVALPLVWYLPAYGRGGRLFLETSVLSENFYMPLGEARGLGVAHHRNVFYYFSKQLEVLLPIVLFLPLVARWVIRRDVGPARSRLLCWFTFGFLVLLMASNKRGHYLVPLQPLVSVLIGRATESWLGESPSTRFLRWGTFIAGALAGLVGIAGIIIVLQPSIGILSASVSHWVTLLRWPLCGLSLAGLGLGAFLLVASRRGPGMLVAAALSLGVYAAFVMVEGTNEARAVTGQARPFIRGVLARIPPGANPPIVPEIHGYALEFYWPGRLVHDERAMETASLFFVQSDRIPRESTTFEILGVYRPTRYRDQDVSLVRRK